MDAVEIEALPKDLVDELTVNVAQLSEIGDKVTVGDIQLPQGVTILTEADHPIAVVEETKAQMSEEAEAPEAEGESAPEAENAPADQPATPKEES